jgi:hypothetical protein
MTGSLILKLLSRSVLLWVGVVFFAVGVVFAFFGVDEWRKQQRFEKEAVQTQATIVAKTLERATRENTRTRYLVTYRFTAADGQVVEQTGEVTVDEWERMDEGSPYAVAYLPSEPRNVRAAGGDDQWAPLAFIGFGGVFAIIGAVMGAPPLRRLLLVLRLGRTGLEAEGTVLDVWATSTTINRVRQWQLRYEFRDHLGRPQRGESDLLSPEEAAQWKPGDRGTVRFDRARPEKNIWAGAPESPSEEAEPSAREPVSARIRIIGALKRIMGYAVMLGVVFIVIILAELPPVQYWAGVITQHEDLLLSITVGIGVLGFVLFMGSVLSLAMAQDKPMRHEDVEDLSRSVKFAARPAAWRASSYRIWGQAVGQEGGDAFTVAEMKAAWQAGALFGHPVWRRRLIVSVGVLMFAFGLFGSFVVIGPPWIKLLMAGALLYAIIRLSWALWKA